MLIIQNIRKTFNTGTVNEKIALNDISLTLKDGDFITVIGGNGAGKSTLLNAIAGTFLTDRGTMEIDGIDFTRLSEAKRAAFLGRVFQDPMMGTASDLWIQENMALANRRGQRRGLRWSITGKEKELYQQLLSELDLGLENRLTTKVGLLSGGQRQALTLLMAVMKKPKLLLLDEHTAALDPKTAAKVMAMSNHFIREGLLTVLMVTHNMKDAIANGNRLIMMNNGQVILDVNGAEKQRLTVDDLLAAFSRASGTEFANDRALLV
ncbi:MAG TPA: ATP-binding cassette domain-containing protein [Bacillota bacterium]|nr:ATP-binding cassette domain-containing protein [Bacillota bacterium]